MARTDPRVDAYIAKQAPFAQEILRHIRKQVHASIPNVEETLKWGMPFFTLGESALVCHMAGFEATLRPGILARRLGVGRTNPTQRREPKGRKSKRRESKKRKRDGILRKNPIAGRPSEGKGLGGLFEKSGRDRHGCRNASPQTQSTGASPAARDSPGAQGGFCPQRGRRAPVQPIHPIATTGIHRLDFRGQNRSHAGKAFAHGPGMDGRG